jgi:hypothetical protein
LILDLLTGYFEAFASASARLRNFDIVAADGSFRLLFFGRRLRLVT